jgi:antitoxin component YwqK of YwqJK toxin-antitoxin module
MTNQITMDLFSEININFSEIQLWQEFYENGNLFIDGKIAVVFEMSKSIYNYRLGFKGYEGKPVCRIGVWTKYFNNGQIAWQIDYGDGTLGYKSGNFFPSFRKDGSSITYC